MSSDNKYILVLPSWYPSRADKFNGDFHLRFVEAISKKRRQVVVYVIMLENLLSKQVECFEAGNTTTIFGYYPRSKARFSILRKASHISSWLGLYSKILFQVFRQQGRPVLTHVFVFWPAGLIALAIKCLCGINFLITENWTSFYAENPGNIYKHSLIQRFVNWLILKNASHIIAVCHRLADKIKRLSAGAKISVIPNVVDTALFIGDGNNDLQVFSFVHISSMKYQKNVDGLLRGFESFSKSQTKSVRLTLIGPVTSELTKQINSSSLLKDNIKIIGEVSYERVASELKKHHCMVLFSRYENLPCVMLESLCLGVPVISTDVGGCTEIINSSNGIIVPSEDIGALTSAMHEIVSNYAQFNRNEIAEKARENYSYTNVADHFEPLFNEYMK